MSDTNGLAPAYAALDKCTAAVTKLEAMCCMPERSPSMEALATSLEDVRTKLSTVHDDQAAADATVASLEDVGAQVGRLQVGCCAPARLPLYATVLEGLTTVQLTVNRALDRGH